MGKKALSGMNTAFSDMSLSSTADSKPSKKDKDGEKEKRKLFKMRWGSHKD